MKPKTGDVVLRLAKDGAVVGATYQGKEVTWDWEDEHDDTTHVQTVSKPTQEQTSSNNKAVPLPGHEYLLNHEYSSSSMQPGHVYISAKNALPSMDTEPFFSLRMYDGLSAVEVELVVDGYEGAALTTAHFETESAKAATESLAERLSKTEGVAPGILMDEPGGTLQAISKSQYVAGNTHTRAHDPILRTYRRDAIDNWRPALTKDDFVGIYCSNWKDVHKNVQLALGHDGSQLKFYAVTRCALPVEMCDQLCIAARVSGNSWHDWVAGEHGAELKRARILAVSIRDRMLNEVLTAYGLRRKQIRAQATHTFSDYLEHRGDHALAYVGSACTEVSGGVLLRRPGASPPQVYWLHGPAKTPTTLGGDGWAMPKVSSGVPVFPSARKGENSTNATKRFMDAVVNAGYETRHGHARLQPVLTTWVDGAKHRNHD
jgi:hypothetical protein